MLHRNHDRLARIGVWIPIAEGFVVTRDRSVDRGIDRGVANEPCGLGLECNQGLER